MSSWDLFRELDNLRQEIDQAFKGFGSGRAVPPAFRTGSGRFPLANLREDDNNYYVEALLPGVEPQELEVTVLRNALTLAGERKQCCTDDPKCIWHRSERGYGHFQRTIELPAAIDGTKIKAEAKNGVLLITLVKAEEAKPKRIAVAVS
jgi:HSP20 family protein